MNSKSNTPKAWQKDVNNIKTAKVQFWQNGIMVTAQMDRMKARELVATHQAFVISTQAIGALKNGQYNS